MTTTKKQEELLTITDEHLISLIEERISYKHIIEEAEAIVKRLDSEIKKAIEDSGSHTVIAGTHKVSLSKYTKESVPVDVVREILSQAVFESIVKRSLVTRLIVK